METKTTGRQSYRAIEEFMKKALENREAAYDCLPVNTWDVGEDALEGLARKTSWS